MLIFDAVLESELLHSRSAYDLSLFAGIIGSLVPGLKAGGSPSKLSFAFNGSWSRAGPTMAYSRG